MRTSPSSHKPGASKIWLAAIAGLSFALVTGCANPEGLLAGLGSAVERPGAIWVIDSNGSGVNGNIFASKDDVWADGGPNGNAGEDHGLPDGSWVIGVTDAGGHNLLSPAPLATVDVRDGRFAARIHLAPFADSTNGVYKVWAMPAELYPYSGSDSQSGFRPTESRTEEFKVSLTTGGTGDGGGTGGTGTGDGSDGNGCPNSYGAIYGDIFGDVWGDIYGDLYGEQFGDLHGNLYGNRFGNMFGNQYGSQYGDFYGDQFGDRYGTLYGTMHGEMFGDQFGDVNPSPASGCPQ